jgi:hypothetical protein
LSLCPRLALCRVSGVRGVHTVMSRPCAVSAQMTATPTATRMIDQTGHVEVASHLDAAPHPDRQPHPKIRRARLARLDDRSGRAGGGVDSPVVLSGPATGLTDSVVASTAPFVDAGRAVLTGYQGLL